MRKINLIYFSHAGLASFADRIVFAAGRVSFADRIFSAAARSSFADRIFFALGPFSRQDFSRRHDFGWDFGGGRRGAKSLRNEMF